MSLIDSLLDRLAPHDCVGCGREGSLLCPACSQTLPAKTNVPNQTLKVRTATLYEGLAKDLIWKLKSGGAQAAAKIMARQMVELIPKGPRWIIVPVPTATSRVRQRGYDQAKLLARALSRQTGLAYLNCLARHGQAHQVGAARHERLQQIKSSLRVKKSVRGLFIILVDDVTTTGATLETATAVLKQAGARHIQAVTFAYKPRAN